jgi:lambda repressor-like predicted transcriptional regulator
VSARRYPLEPLAAAAGVSVAALGRLLGVSGSTWKLARDRGVLERVADRYAVKLGLHPLEVWPEMFDLIEEERLERRRQIARESARRRYHEDPAVRERRKQAAARWRAESPRALAHQPSRQPEARKVHSRAYYMRNAEAIRAKQRARYRQQKGEAA